MAYQSSRSYDLIWVIIIFGLIANIFNFASPNIPDPDSFYHLAHARLYRTEGLSFNNFAWMYYSAIRTQRSDIWYGFHIFLIPFSFFNGTLGIKTAGAVLTFITLISLWFVFRRHKIKWPAFWPILIFISAPNIMNRLLMTRPHLLSLALSVLLFSFLLNREYWKIFIVSAAVAWIHISLAWVSFLIFGVIFIVKIFAEKIRLWRESLIVLSGSVVGLLARPNPIGSLKLAYIQVVKLMLEKQNQATLLFGRELFPLAPQTLFQNFSAFIVLWFLAMALAFILVKKHSNILKNVGMWSAGVLAIIFFILTIAVARRAHDFWIPFGIIFTALVYTELAKHRHILKNTRLFSDILIFCVFLFLVFYTPWRNSVSLEERAIPPNKFKETALWLKDNSRPGDIVFNIRWSDFPMLFFWDGKNYYIGGMDPIFQYAYDEKLYWKFHYLSADQVSQKTCPAPACTAAMLEDTYTVLKSDFKAKYVFLEKSRNPNIYQYLNTDKIHYTNKKETVGEAVFQIN